MSYKIIDNFLDKEYFKEIEKLFTSSDFPWFYNDKVNLFDEETYFTHLIYIDFKPNSNFYNNIFKIVLKLKPKALLRIKANLYLKTKKKIIHAKHKDYDMPHKGAIFYINTNNGKTILENGTKVDSVANRMLFFDSSKKHSSTTCTDKKVRLNINFNYL
jgi:hypothetical protein